SADPPAPKSGQEGNGHDADGCVLASREGSGVGRSMPSAGLPEMTAKDSPLVPRPTLIHPLTSILEALEPAGLFPRTQPLEVELGSGDGSFAVDYARLHPDRNFLAVERLLGRLRKIERKGLRAGLANLRLVRIEASYLVEFL